MLLLFSPVPLPSSSVIIPSLSSPLKLISFIPIFLLFHFFLPVCLSFFLPSFIFIFCHLFYSILSPDKSTWTTLNGLNSSATPQNHIKLNLLFLTKLTYFEKVSQIIRETSETKLFYYIIQSVINNSYIFAQKITTLKLKYKSLSFLKLLS